MAAASWRASETPAPRSWKRQTFISSALVFLTAVLGIWTQAVLAATLGLSGAADAYFSALALSMFVTYILTQTVINRWVPELAALLDPAQVPTRAFWAAGWRLTRWVALVGFTLGALLFFTADFAVGLVGPGLSDVTRDLAAASMRVMSLPLGIQLSASGLVAIQYALQGQPIIQGSGLLYSVSVIPAVVLLTPVVGPMSAAIGASASFCLMFLVVLGATVLAARRRISSFEPPAKSGNQGSVAVITLASIVVFGQTVVGPMIASTLAPGTVAQLSFAYRPAEVLARALPTVIAYSVMPALAAAHARRDATQVDTAISEVLRLALGLMLPVAALLAAIREPLITLLYQRSAFSLEAVQAVAPTLGWYAAGLPAYSIVLVLNTIFISVGRERWALGLGMAILSAYAVLGFALGRTFGGEGVALGFCLASVAVAIAGIAATGRRDARRLLNASWFRWSAFGAVLAVLGGTLGVELTRGQSVVVQLATALVLGGVGVAAGVAGAEAHLFRAVLGRVAAPGRDLGVTQPRRVAMVLNFPRNYQDGVTGFANRLHTALAGTFQVEALTVAPTRFEAYPGRPDLQMLVAAEQLIQLLIRRPAAVHVHEHPVALAAGVVYRGLTLGCTRLVYTLHVQPTERRAYWKRAILGWLLARCSAVTCVSADTAARLADIATPAPANVSVIYGGAEIEPRHAQDPAIARFRAHFGVYGGPVLCQIGLNFPLKVAGVFRLLQALRLVAQEFPSVRLILVGEGTLRSSVAEAAARLGLADAVIFTGYQDDITIPLTVTDIYCHITFQDAAPLSVLEAMSCGKPIIAARMGGIPELVRDGIDAILVEPDPACIAEAIVALLKNPEQTEALARAAKESATKRYSWNRAAAEFAVLYGLPPDART